MKSGNLNFLEPCGPLQACNGTALLLPYPFFHFFSTKRVKCRLCPDTVNYLNVKFQRREQQFSVWVRESVCGGCWQELSRKLFSGSGNTPAPFIKPLLTFQPAVEYGWFHTKHNVDAVFSFNFHKPITFSARTYTHLHAHTRIYTHLHAHTRTYTHLHAHTRTYTHLHAHTRIYTHKFQFISRRDNWIKLSKVREFVFLFQYTYYFAIGTFVILHLIWHIFRRK
jgi:hypothetical protein